MKRCPFCNSIWVCWNWVHVPLEIYKQLNPHKTEEELRKTLWGHECWNCGDDIGGACFTTEHKIRNGVPYWLMKLYFKVKYRLS